MLYDWTVDEPPFTGDSTMSVMAQHIHAAPVPPSERRRDVPDAVNELILRLLAKDPDDRPASAAEVRTALATASGC